jgi:hypothetical protein
MIKLFFLPDPTTTSSAIWFWFWFWSVEVQIFCCWEEKEREYYLSFKTVQKTLQTWNSTTTTPITTTTTNNNNKQKTTNNNKSSLFARNVKLKILVNLSGQLATTTTTTTSQKLWLLSEMHQKKG